jgi:preprotein translocase subunit YajC
MLFSSNAYADAAAQAEPSPLFTFIMFGGLFIFMYFIMIRPQQKRQKEHNNLIGSLSKGDEVVLSSGLLGKISKLDAEYMVLEAGNGQELKFQRVAVHAVLPKGTIKAI